MQAEADRHADDLAHQLGKALRIARLERGLSQRAASNIAGVSPSMWSHLEVARDGRGTLATWNRAAVALGSGLKGYLAELSAADLPRDSVHLRHQELIIRTARVGGWRALPEEPIDRDVGKSRSADVLLQRPLEYALIDVWDWFDDVGAPARQWRRRLDAVERYAIARMAADDALPRVSGAWVVRASQRNRQLIHDHRNFFVSLFPGSGAAWLAALTTRTAPMPSQSALLWVTVKGDRLYPARLGVAR